MELTKSKFELKESRARTSVLLRSLGVEAPNGVSRLSKAELELILHDARQLYKTRIAQVAPRALGDPQEEATRLNAVWAQIEKRFNYYLNPQVSFHPAPALPRRPKRRVPTIGQCRVCRNPFEMNRYNSVFCGPACAKEGKLLRDRARYL